MNFQVVFWSFFVLMIMHVVGDFLTPYRQIDTTKWWTILLSEWVLVLNPLHGIWDKWSPLRQHKWHIQTLQEGWKYTTTNDDDEIVLYIENNKNDMVQLIDNMLFWRWLAVDQLYHVLTNVLVALFIGGLI